MITLAEFKSKANILKNYLSQNNASITHSSCLHAVAKIYGFKDWNTASAFFDDQGDVSNKINIGKEGLSDLISSKVMEGALYKLMMLCGVHDISKGFTVIKGNAGSYNDIPIAFKIQSSDNLHQEMISCGNFSSINDKDEIEFLSGHYLAYLIHGFLKTRNFNNNSARAINKVDRESSEMHDDIDYKKNNSYKNKLMAALRGKQVEIIFECLDYELKPTLKNVKNLIELTPIMDDHVFMKIENMLSDYYVISDGFDNELLIWKMPHPEFNELDSKDLIATIKSVGK